ncbi:MAG: filamentous hemagglutinin family protein [Verrucomicrobiae bacterium]
MILAGDILRGGAGAGAGRKAADARTSAGAQAAELSRIKASDRLARTTQAINAMRQMQASARTAAGGSVPDGLVPGGLERLAGGTWAGAALPSQSGGNVSIKQTASQALLDWKTFHVGSGTTVHFDQSAGGNDSGKWVAFNKVFDPSGKPSEIRGRIKADGQVYIINQNGIIFGAGSQVNARTLVASSLPINDNLIARGLLNQEKGKIQFLFSALPADGFDTANASPSYVPYARSGEVVVEKGAFLGSPVSQEGYGGRVMLVGRNVRNDGVIATPAGQTILSAGLQVGIDASKAPSLRGLDVYVGAVSDAGLGISGGEAKNTGLIEAARGSISMVGRNILQQGTLESSTSVDVNGRVDLLANYDAVANQGYDPTLQLGSPFLSRSTGLVELGENSIVRVLPEWDHPKKLATSSLPLRSMVDIQGRTIHLAPGATVLAPSAEVNLDAGEWIYEPSATSPQSTFVYSSGQIYLDQNSLLDVSGSTDVFIPLAHSIMTFQLRGSELADSPLQRSANLRAVELTMDMRTSGSFYGRNWVGTPLGDVTGYLNLIERNVAQLTMEGGNIAMRAGGSVVIRKGAVVDASGGYARNEGGKIQTSRIRLGLGLVNIDEATPDRLYDGIYDGKNTQASKKWGVSKTFASSLAPLGGYSQTSYISGANAGSLAISAPSMALDGEMSAGRIIGPRQLRSSQTSSNLPQAGRLELAFESQVTTTTYPKFGTISPTPPRIVFRDGFASASPAAFTVASDNTTPALLTARTGEVVLAPDLLGDEGFGELAIRNADGDIVIGNGMTLRVPAGGSLDFKGANISVEGNLFAPGGSISLLAYNYSPYLAKFLNPVAPLPAASAGRGTIRLAAGSAISAAGQIHDDRPTGLLGSTQPIAIHGGQILLEAFSVELAKGSTVDVSGGIVYPMAGKSKYGKAGAISILAGQDPNLKGILGGHLDLKAALSGFSGKDYAIDDMLAGISSGRSGGSLTIKAPLVQVGGSSTRDDAFLVQPSFFNEGGFSKFELIGIGATGAGGQTLPGLLIAPGTVIEPVVSSSVAVPYSLRGGANFQTVLKPVGKRDPVSLTFRATGAKDPNASMFITGAAVMGEGAVIRTDPLGEVVMKGETVEVLGSIDAPGGTISIGGAITFPVGGSSAGPVALPTAYIGPNANLSTAGTSLLLPDPFGRRRGYVLPGGRIMVSGNIVAEAGAVLDVSGTAGVLDLTPSELGLLDSPQAPVNSGINSALFSRNTTRTQVASSGGEIVLAGSELMVSDATLLGRAGGPAALGGWLSVSSGRYVSNVAPDDGSSTSADINMEVVQSGMFLGGARRGIGIPVTDTLGAALKGMGYFAADTFSAGGFSSLELRGNVRFKGPVSLPVEKYLLVGDGGVVTADSAVNLTAAYIRIGQEFPIPGQNEWLFSQTPASGSPTEFHPSPTSGPGKLTLSAPLIDMGSLVLKNISTAEFSAIGGDIRGSGTFAMAGDLVMRAGQIYPATAAGFDLFSYDNTLTGTSGSVTIEGAGARPLPMSAGGSLRVMASLITQGGTLRAPMGTISLGWDGLTAHPVNALVGDAAGALATPATKTLILGEGSVTSVSAIDPFTGLGVVIPYGMSPDGLRWIDPTGLDVTTGGVPAKAVSLGAQNLDMQAGSVVDVRGGGDLYAYRWVQGPGGYDDILASENRFAILPGYAFNYAPSARFNSFAMELLGNAGYSSSKLGVGDQITLKASGEVPAGTYTLLPARYALLPGAMLVTPFNALGASSTDPLSRYQKTTPGSIGLQDGSYLVAGYQSSGLTPGKGQPATFSTFQLLPQSATRKQSEYQDFYANDFLSSAAAARAQTPQRLPADSGSVQFLAGTGLSLSGSVLASTAPGGRGGTVDIAAQGNIWVADRGAAAPAGAIKLNASMLADWGGESLLIGGFRSGDNVTVRGTTLTLDNRSSAFIGPEIILAASQTVTLADDARIASSGEMTQPAAALKLSGDGALVRVSGDPSASILRTGFVGLPAVGLTIGAGASISGPGLTIDSTYDTALNPLAILDGRAINLNSGRISILLDAPGAASPAFGLVLGGPALGSLAGAGALSFLSYSSLDFYGTGVLPIGTPDSLTLRAGAIRGFNKSGGTVAIRAGELLLDNSQGASDPLQAQALDGTLALDVKTLRVGANTVAVRQFSNLVINAPGGIHGEGIGGLTTEGGLTASTSTITAAAASQQTFSAAGDLAILSAPGAGTYSSGLGAKYTMSGKSVGVGSDIILPSGRLLVTSTAGSVSLGGLVDLRGKAQSIFDVTRYTDGGSANLSATGGDVIVSNEINVSAQALGGDAGSITISAPSGKLQIAPAGKLVGGIFGASGTAGSFSLDVKGLGAAGEFDALNTFLDAGLFVESRSFRARTGDVTLAGTATAREFSLATDAGDITVTGEIKASGPTGGAISLASHGALKIASGALLTVEGDDFDSAGKGGRITLEAGAQLNGIQGTGGLTLEAGSILDLHVKTKVLTSSIDEFYGRFSGTLHLRAPRVGGGAGNEIAISEIQSTIIDPSSIVAEGSNLYSNTTGDITGAAGTITSALQTKIKSEADSFFGIANANYLTMAGRLLASNPGLSGVFVLAPGAEIINTAGDLTLGTTLSTAASDWNLAAFRFGPNSAPGVLTMRASGNLLFYNALSDGFNGGTSLWLSPLLAQNASLPINTQTWSYRLTAGADLASADFRAVKGSSGSLKLGKDYGNATPGNSGIPGSGGGTLQTSSIVATRYQVIRTGSGDITINAAADVQLLNQFATIYTAGTQVAHPGYISAAGDFVTPLVYSSSPLDPVTRINNVNTVLGAQSVLYPAQYAIAGGNVEIHAGNDVAHLTDTDPTAGIKMGDDSSRQMPTSWLGRRGYVAAGTFGAVGASSGAIILNDPSASTTWWVDYSNFFEGVGTLGGGNIVIEAGNDVKNIDAVAPTNARASSDGSTFLELGGGDVSVAAGRDISGGVYYVERGSGTLAAGGSIKTNQTRSPTLGIVGSTSNWLSPKLLASDTWLATTLFVGKGGFDIKAGGDILLGPVANAFLMPQGLGNKYWYKTYFSTYGSNSYVNVLSLGGDVTHRLSTTLKTEASSLPSLQAWYQSQLLYKSSTDADGNYPASYYQPWLRLSESSVAPFSTVSSLMPPIMKSTALSGSVNMVGDLTLFPSSGGTLELVAADQVEGLFSTGFSRATNANIYKYATINVSDASPANVPGAMAPRAFFDYVAKSSVTGLPVATTLAQTVGSQARPFLSDLDSAFVESGSYAGANAVSQTKQARHSLGLLHTGDASPVRIYAVSGDISGITLFTPKATWITAGNDITDIAFHLQNVSKDDTSFVSAGRDIILNNSNTPTRQAMALAESNKDYVKGFASLAGDIQVSGEGSLEVLAGRNLDLGTALKGGIGEVGQGITSIGNARNPYLAFGGASLYVAAGLGNSAGLANAGLEADAFLDENFEKYHDEVAKDSEGATADPLTMNSAQRAQLALRVLALVLRDSGRDSVGTGTYKSGFAAIETLFGDVSSGGDINTRNRDIRTKSGGLINIVAPGGSLIMAENKAAQSAARPSLGNFAGTGSLMLVSTAAESKAPEGIVTEYGGNVSIFTDGNVGIGQARIFTLRGGNIVIWASTGDIAAGAAAKTVSTAPPTRVLIDPQSATIETDLSGLATGGGIGVLSTVAGVQAGNVDLIAPGGTVDAGDAGIRATGNLNIAAVQVLNADNIAASGSSSGVPSAPTVAAPNVSGLSSASSSSAASSSAANQVANQARPNTQSEEQVPSTITVEVLGYGGGEDEV